MFQSDTPSGADWHHILGHQMYPMALVISFALLEFVGNIEVDGKLSSSVRWLSSSGIPLLAVRLLEDSPVDFFVAQTCIKEWINSF